MKKLYFLLLITAVLVGCNQDPQEKAKALFKKASTIEEADRQAKKLLSLMTPDEKFKLACAGTEGRFGITPIDRLGIPGINFRDASAGIHIYEWQKEEFWKSTSFPSLQLLTATFDTSLVRQYSHAVGEECRGYNIHFLLGPGLNLHRNSLYGRNFEYVGEDPYLASQVIETYVRGLQSTGTAATLKTFFGNECEVWRKLSNSVIPERARHEIYFAPVKAGIDAGAKAVMTGYNFIEGEWTGQSKYVITDILRNKLGFKWLVMSDWVSVWDGVKVANSGLDLEMPLGQALKYDSAKVFGTPQIDRMAKNILRTCIYQGYYEDGYADSSLLENWDQRAAIAYETNIKGITLLRNEGILPIDPSSVKGKILVSGINAKRLELSGGGSSHVTGYNNLTYLQAAEEAFGEDNVKYIENPSDKDLQSADKVFLFCGYAETGSVYEGEGWDRLFDMVDEGLIKRAVSLNQNTVVCLQTGGHVPMEWKEETAAIIQAYYGGQTGATALMDIITGKENPSGRLPYTFEKKFEDSPAYGYNHITSDKLRRIPYRANYPDWMVNAFAEFTSDKDTAKCYIVDINYDEGIFMGYRWYDKKNLDVHFPFGFGLSYTTFAYDGLALQKDGDDLIVSFNVQNTGKVAGDEITQAYVTDKECSVERPLKELKGFQRVTLNPGETKKVEIILNQDAFKFYDDTDHEWKFEPGEFNIKVGASSRDIRLNKDIVL